MWKEIQLWQPYSYFSFVLNGLFVWRPSENNKFGNPDASHEEAMLHKKKLLSWLYPVLARYQTKIGEGQEPVSLSENGELSFRTRRAIIKDAPIIILDEAAANVDLKMKSTHAGYSFFDKG